MTTEREDIEGTFSIRRIETISRGYMDVFDAGVWGVHCAMCGVKVSLGKFARQKTMQQKRHYAKIEAKEQGWKWHRSVGWYCGDCVASGPDPLEFSKQQSRKRNVR